MRSAILLALIVLAAGGRPGTAAAQRAAAVDLEAILDRAGRRVEEYFARAATVVATETVRVQPVGRDLMPLGFARHLVYELRVSWEPPESPATMPEVNVLRQVLAVNGRPPAKPGRPGNRGNNDEDGCFDPKAVSAEPLEMLLPDRRSKFTFTPAGPGRSDGRPALMIDYRSAEPKTKPTITWQSDTCGNMEMPGYQRGRVWVDAVSGDVLRLDEAVDGFPELQMPRDKIAKGFGPTLRVERADSSIRYKVVSFDDPSEHLLLPSSIETLTVITGSGTPRRRTVHTYSGYKRFLTGGRIVTRP
jgi:hypothetical protein